MKSIKMIAALAAILAAPFGANAQPLGLGTSPQGTMTYALAAAVAKVLHEKRGIQARVQPNSATHSMIPLVDSGEIDMGFCNTLELYEAVTGAGTFDNRPHPKLRAVAVLFPLKVGFFVRKDSAIKTIADLKGKSIPYGFAGGKTMKTITDALLASAGLSVDQLTPIMVPNLVRGADEFISGRADVAAFAPGTGKVSEADSAVGIRYLPVPNDEAALRAMKKVFPSAYVEITQPAPNMAGIETPTPLMMFNFTIFAHEGMPAERVKEIVAALAENKDALAGSFALFKEFDPAQMYRELSVPYHEGALAYFKEHKLKKID